jgi:hypothetical protein
LREEALVAALDSEFRVQELRDTIKQLRNKVCTLQRAELKVPAATCQVDEDAGEVGVDCVGTGGAQRKRRSRAAADIAAFFDGRVEGGCKGESAVAVLESFMHTHPAVLDKLLTQLKIPEEMEQRTVRAIEREWTAERAMALKSRCGIGSLGWQRVINYTSKDYKPEMGGYVLKTLPGGTPFPSWGTNASRNAVAHCEDDTVAAFKLSVSDDGKAASFDVKTTLLSQLTPENIPVEGPLKVIVIGDATGVFQSTRTNMTSVVVRPLHKDSGDGNKLSNNLHWMLYEGIIPLLCTSL